MRKKIAGLITSTIMAVGIPITLTTATEASAVTPARATCSSVRSTTVSHVDEFDHFRGHFNDLWRDTLYWQDCGRAGWFLRSHKFTMTHRGSTNCFFGDFQVYKMNATPLGPSNPRMVQWACVTGKVGYVKWRYVNQFLRHSASDKCWYSTWARAMQARPDVHGRTNTACFH